MNFIETCIKRPVFTIVMTIILMLIGIVCYNKLVVQEMPNVETSSLSVDINYPGANPEVVESQVTKVLEGSFATIQGVDVIHSRTMNEGTKITIALLPGKDVDSASADVRDRIFRVKDKLPKDTTEPVIYKADADATPIMKIVVDSTRYTVDEVRDIVEKNLKTKFECLNGVARVDIDGGSDFAMKIILDPQKMASYGLTPIDVREMLKRQHMRRPGGKLITKDKEYMIMLAGDMTNAEQFNDLVISTVNGRAVKIMDIGNAEFKPKEVKNGVLYNGKNCVSISIYKQSTSNPLDVGTEVKKAMNKSKAYLPGSIEMKLSYDVTAPIKRSIHSVYQALLETVVLVVMVVFLFLWSFRAAVIPLVVIPVSLISTFIFLYLFDFSINTLTLMAMVLSTGLVVDDSIVVVENVDRVKKEGHNLEKASTIGTTEIAFAIIAMTMTLAAVYSPMALTNDKLSKMFKEFALALTSSVIISGFVALTLTPMMCAKILKTKHSKGEERVAIIFGKIENTYGTILKKIMQYKGMAVFFSVLFACMTYFAAYMFLKKESFPPKDNGYLRVDAEGPVDASYQYMEKYTIALDKIIRTFPEVESTNLTITGNSVEGNIKLVPWEKRNTKAHGLIIPVQQALSKNGGLNAFVRAGGGGSLDGDCVNFVLEISSGDYEYLAAGSNMIQSILGGTYRHMFSRIESTLARINQEYVVEFNRDRAASVGIKIADIAESIEALFKGDLVAKVKRDNKRYDVLLLIDEKHKMDTKDIMGIFIRAPNSENKNEPKMISVADLIKISQRKAPTYIFHYDQLMATTFKADLMPTSNIGEALALVEMIKSQLPNDMIIDYIGSTKMYIEGSTQIYFIFVMALLFIYLFLSALFESFIDPLIVLVSVPFSLSGSMIGLMYINDGSFNIYSQIGLITTLGLIIKHGILIVDFANKILLLNQNMSRLDAAIEAAILRLRPILMTTIAMVFGAIPLAMSTGAGAELKRQIGCVIVSGMSIGTLFTCIVVPAVYAIFSRKRKLFELS